MDPVLLIPARLYGSRKVAGTTQHFTVAQRTFGTDNVSCCGWIYCDESRSYNTLIDCGLGGGSSTGFSINVRSDYSIRVACGNGTASYHYIDTAASVIAVATWNFILVTMDRTGNCTIYVNNSAIGSPVSIAAYSGSVGDPVDRHGASATTRQLRPLT